jgi:hypothetical protein
MIAGASSFYAVTNDAQAFSGSISSAGVAVGSFQDGGGTTSTLNFNMTSMSGTYSQSGGKGGGTLSLSRSGTCAVSPASGGGPGGGGGPSPTPTPTPSPSNAGGGNVLLGLSISWGNTPTSAGSISVSLTVFDATIANLGHQTQSESEPGAPFDTGAPTSTTDNISASWATGTGATYQVTVGGPCTVTNGSGSIQSNGPYPTVQITCN